jgi:hypothetical protein
MLLTNHALTGILLGELINEPLIAFPAGVASHLLLDTTPHASWRPGPFRYPRLRDDPVGMRQFLTPGNVIVGALDGFGAVSVLVAGLIAFPDRRPSVIAGWFGGVGPDLFYLVELVFKRRAFPRFKAFHHRIQWSESPYGIATEVVWAFLVLHWLHFI